MQTLNLSLDSTSTTSETIEDEILCAQYETYTPVRFVLISTATVIACLGTVANVLLVYMFSSKRNTNTNTPATLYPTVLALLDAAICFEYLLLFGLDAIVSYLRVESLFVLYYLYIIPAYVASRITQLMIPYMLIFATLERLYWASSSGRSKSLSSFHSATGRHVTVLLSLAACCLLRLPTAFAMMVADYPACPDFFRTMTTMPRPWVHDSYAYFVFDLHVMTIAQTIVPFVLLVALNMVIVHKMLMDSAQKDVEASICFNEERNLTPTSNKSSTTNGLSLAPLKSMSASVRSAVFTMAAIVASYLISNILHLILTFLERAEHPLLKSEEDPLLSSTFHSFFSDLVSFVYMFTSAIRIAIYYGCNPRMRDVLNEFFGLRKAVYV